MRHPRNTIYHLNGTSSIVSSRGSLYKITVLDETTRLKQRLLDKSAPIAFKKTMGLLGATTLGVGALMGAGLYVLVGIASAEAGPALPVAYVICGGLTFLSVMMFADLSRRLPISGGGYAYAYHQLGSFWGFMVGWSLAVGSIFACAMYAYGFGSYFASFLPQRLSGELTYKLLASGLVVVLLFLGTRSGKGGDRVQQIFTWGNLLVLLVLVGVAIPLMTGAHFTPFLPNGAAGVGSAISLIYISFFGYQLIANSAEEINSAKKTVPRAMGIAMGIALVFYVLVGIVSVGAIDWKELAADDAPLVLLASRAVGPWGAWLIGAGGILASGAALNSTIVSQSRQIFAMGRDRLLPKTMGSVSRSTGVPVAALLAGGGVTVAVLLLADLEFIAKAANFSLLFSMLPISLALHRLYGQESSREGGEPVPLWRRAVPWAALAANTALMMTLDWQSLMFGGVLVGVGCAVFLSYSYASEKRGRAGFSVDLAEKDRAFNILKQGDRILVPIANPETLESLFSISRALLPTEGGEIIALRVVETSEGTTPREALRSTSGTSDALAAAELANEIARARDLPVRPVVRAATCLPEGIVHAAVEERCRMIVMGWSSERDGGPSQLVRDIASKVRSDLVLLNLRKDVRPRKIGVALGGFSNLPLMVRVATTLAEDFQGAVNYLNVVPPGFDRAHLRHARQIQMAAIERHASLVPFGSEILVSDNPLEAITEKSEELDMLVVGTAHRDAFKDDTIGAFSTMIAQQARCSVVLVRKGARTLGS